MSRPKQQKPPLIELMARIKKLRDEYPGKGYPPTPWYFKSMAIKELNREALELPPLA